MIMPGGDAGLYLKEREERKGFSYQEGEVPDLGSLGFYVNLCFPLVVII